MQELCTVLSNGTHRSVLSIETCTKVHRDARPQRRMRRFSHYKLHRVSHRSMRKSVHRDMRYKVYHVTHASLHRSASCHTEKFAHRYAKKYAHMYTKKHALKYNFLHADAACYSFTDTRSIQSEAAILLCWSGFRKYTLTDNISRTACERFPDTRSIRAEAGFTWWSSGGTAFITKMCTDMRSVIRDKSMVLCGHRDLIFYALTLEVLCTIAEFCRFTATESMPSEVGFTQSSSGWRECLSSSHQFRSWLGRRRKILPLTVYLNPCRSDSCPSCA